MSSYKSKNPIMYFEEEGYDRLHYFKFFPETEKVEHGIFTFDFDREYYEKKFIEKRLNKWFCDKNNIMYKYVNEKREEYIYNLINDNNIEWYIYNLDYKDKDPKKYSEIIFNRYII